MFGKKLKKLTAVLLSMVMLVTITAVAVTADEPEEIDYTINNTYEDVDWSTWGQYKASLHNHTWASDGNDDFADMIERHYELGYDVLAITDHGTTDYSWTEVNTVPVLFDVLSLSKGRPGQQPTPLTPERFEEITTGADRDGRGMLRVPYGIEQNPTSFNNAHVNSFFADWGNGYLGGTSDYETPLKNIEKAGGLTVLNHLSEYTNARNVDPESAYNEDYTYHINKFSNLLIKYPTCLGLDINSKGDGRTKNDRKLWDILLQEVVPTGRNVFAFATSDAHSLDAIDSAWTIMLMPENNVENLRASMETGAFFAGSRNNQNTKEVAFLSDLLGTDLGTTWKADAEVAQPVVTEIAVDQAENTITIEAENEEVILWIANNEVIATGNSIDLNDYSEEIGSYVRAEIFGEGGILYTQAFTLEYDGAPTGSGPQNFFDFGWFILFFRDIVSKMFHIFTAPFAVA